MSGSDIARIRRQIEEEYMSAKLGLSGLAEGTARHHFITKRMENMWEQFQQLVQVVGQIEAHKIVFGEPLEQQQEQRHGQE